MAESTQSWPAPPRTRSDASWVAGLILAIASVAWMVTTVWSIAGDVRFHPDELRAVVSALRSPDGDARRGLFFLSIVVGIQFSMMVVSIAILRSYQWARWVGLSAALAFGMLTLLALVDGAEPVVPLVVNLVGLVLAAGLLAASLLTRSLATNSLVSARRS